MLLMRGLAKQCISEKTKNSDLSSISSSSDESKKDDDVTEASSQLESLSLDATEIDVKGLKDIIAFLRLNPPLKSLSLNENENLSDKLRLLWKVFAKRRNVSLKFISLSGNKMLNEDLDSFFELMDFKSSMSPVCLTNNEFDENA